MQIVGLKYISPLLLVIPLSILLLSACGTAESGNQTAAPKSSRMYTWMIADSALQRLEQADASGTLAKTYFDTADTYLMGASSASIPAQWQSTLTAVFSSFADLQKAFALHKIPRSVKAIVYDNEAWSFTPTQEQQHPELYDRLAAELVHQYHLIFIATPATNLAQIINPVSGNRYENFLHLGIAGEAARYADVYEIQAQGSEMNTAVYATFVKQAVAQARAANPHIRVLAGLSTNPSGHQVTGEDLYRAVVATQDSVSGYWLNIPMGGSRCPKCGTSHPQVAVDFLKKLSTQS